MTLGFFLPQSENIIVYFYDSEPVDDANHVAVLQVELATTLLRREWKKVLQAIERAPNQKMLVHTGSVARGFALGLLAGEIITIRGYQAMTALISKAELMMHAELSSKPK
ncbi:hypothetical protein CYL20_11830 [Pseudomonas palleroniana]|uniref:Uncharacterized protein n=1 Tax=Pseudomonas palleroniana TaxID=191390 RepID=A0A2L1J9N6_9PSED|nr:hypothetical protein [Pseudomonas palleroniana]AVE05202.1 hypothetical protein CYL20_11830 [Pseudomonas palleroniana]